MGDSVPRLDYRSKYAIWEQFRVAPDGSLAQREHALPECDVPCEPQLALHERLEILVLHMRDCFIPELPKVRCIERSYC